MRKGFGPPDELKGSADVVTVEVMERRPWIEGEPGDLVGINWREHSSGYMYWYPAEDVFTDAQPGMMIDVVPARDFS
jgi:hypothetical protein